jgi:hypothetical protein|tara:strand:+ start:2129 stop:3985 length:1857 start_codon:yes stop_codon:yes gene_type:complete
MALKKLTLKAGINRENTRYTSEGGWYDCDKIRFRQGTPEKIGGWRRISTNTFQGVCRSIWNWVTLGSQNLVGVGTNLKFYIENGGVYYDITPLRKPASNLTNPFAVTQGSTTVVVTDASGGYLAEDFVTFSNASAVGGLTLDGEFQIVEILTTTTYSITASSAGQSSATGGGTVSAAYQINVGPAFAIPLVGWGASAWGFGQWGTGSESVEDLRQWSQANFGEDLIFGPRGGTLYFWDADASGGLNSRGVALSSVSGASNVPTIHNLTLVSDISRFVFCFGSNELGGTTLNPMLVRWSDQEDATNWTPSASNQAGDLILSNGTEIVAAKQARQEVLVWTNSALYSLQYVGAPAVWTAQLVGENISIASQNSVAYASGKAYWMGRDKFYVYDGRTQPLRCDLRKFIFNDFNTLQYPQVFAGTVESYHEVWWFYCSSESTVADKYVVYNYLDDIWYYGNMSRSAWLDSGLRNNPLGATYNYNLVDHEEGVDDEETANTAAIAAHVESAQFDLDDGHQFMFIWRVMPDISFDGSTINSPSASMSLLPLANSGSGYNDPLSEGGSNNATVTRTATTPVEKFTGEVFTRVRGRQMAIKIESSATGVTWQLGSPRIDMRPDGRR